jgi:hypothetical protein
MCVAVCSDERIFHTYAFVVYVPFTINFTFSITGSSSVGVIFLLWHVFRAACVFYRLDLRLLRWRRRDLRSQ